MTVDLHNKHRCGNEMDLILDRHGRLLWVCKKCYHNYPERTLDYPFCPMCGKEMFLPIEINSSYKCESCKRHFKICVSPWDIVILEKGAIPTYCEISENDVWYWLEEIHHKSWHQQKNPPSDGVVIHESQIQCKESGFHAFCGGNIYDAEIWCEEQFAVVAGYKPEEILTVNGHRGVYMPSSHCDKCGSNWSSAGRPALADEASEMGTRVKLDQVCNAPILDGDAELCNGIVYEETIPEHRKYNSETETLDIIPKSVTKRCNQCRKVFP